jgi:hypothetical protein
LEARLPLRFPLLPSFGLANDCQIAVISARCITLRIWTTAAWRLPRRALAGLTELNESLPELPIDAECVLTTLDRIGSPATTGMAGRRYFGFAMGGSFGDALTPQALPK